MRVGDDPQQLESGNQAIGVCALCAERFLFDLEVEEPCCWGLCPSGSSRLPRKEVIQPHLPVRLPCYDFTPITDPTLDACLSEELARRLQVLPTFVV